MDLTAIAEANAGGNAERNRTKKTAKICRVLRACRGVDFYVWDAMAETAELDVWVNNPQLCKDDNHRISEVTRMLRACRDIEFQVSEDVCKLLGVGKGGDMN